MSRLDSYRQKQFRNKMTLYIALLVGLVIFMFVIGFRLLINAGLFVGNIASGSKKVEEKKDSFYGTLTIDNVPNATNSAKIMVSGSVTNYDEIEFYINGKKVEEQDFPTSESFSEEIGDLKPGDNEVYFKAISKEFKKEKESPKYTVLFKNEKPRLEIREPSTENSKTIKSEIIISGQTGSEVFIKVNELPIVVNSEGVFQTIYRLKEGDNTIEIKAEDAAGNSEIKKLTVTREKDE